MKTKINKTNQKDHYLLKHIALIVFVIFFDAGFAEISAYSFNNDSTAIIQKLLALDSIFHNSTGRGQDLSREQMDSLKSVRDAVMNEEYRLLGITLPSAELNEFRKNFEYLEKIVYSKDLQAMSLNEQRDKLQIVIESWFHFLPEFFDRTAILKSKLTNR